MIKHLPLIAIAVAATVLGTVPVLAETTGGTTLGGGDNGAAAKAGETAAARTDGTTKGSPASNPAPGKSTEHSDGTMRGHKNF